MMCLAKEQVECMHSGSERDAGLLHVRNVLRHVACCAKNDPTLFHDVSMPEEHVITTAVAATPSSGRSEDNSAAGDQL